MTKRPASSRDSPQDCLRLNPEIWRTVGHDREPDDFELWSALQGQLEADQAELESADLTSIQASSL